MKCKFEEIKNYFESKGLIKTHKTNREESKMDLIQKKRVRTALLQEEQYKIFNDAPYTYSGKLTEEINFPLKKENKIKDKIKNEMNQKQNFDSYLDVNFIL